VEIEMVTVKDHVVEGLPKSESNGGLLSANTMGLFDHACQSVYQR
jgi:hypothetical protein